MIPRRDFDRYCRQVDNLAEDARLAVAGVLEGGIADPGDVAAARDLAISALTDVLGTYAVASAAAAADFYERSGGSPAVLGDADLRAIEGTVRYQAGKLVDGDVDGFVDQVSEFAAHAVKLSANRQMIKNAEYGSRHRRRKRGWGPRVRFARVPTGPETCTFCTMLASRGFVYWSREDAGEFGHFHRKCDCKVVASTDAEGLEGYDPERYARLHEVFKEIDSMDIPREKMESLKRAALSVPLLNTRADPAVEYFGPAEKDDPSRLDEIFSWLDENGIELVVSSKDRERIGYTPGLAPGEPGQMIVTKGMSLSAWLHEIDHAKYDIENGLPGLKAYMGNYRLREEMERRAYGVEIAIAEQAGYNDLVKSLLLLMNEEIGRLEAGFGAIE